MADQVHERIIRDGDTYRILHSGKSKIVVIKFQSGPISAENKENGIQVEDLLMVAGDRITELNKRLQCVENDIALGCIADALAALHERTNARKDQGVEGTESPHTPKSEKDSDSDDIV